MKSKKMVQNHIFFCDIYIIMGIKIILTESQVANLEKSVGKVEVNEIGKANLSCVSLNYERLMSELGDKEEKKIGYATKIRKVKDYNRKEVNVGVEHHYTDIVTIRPDNTIVIDNGGHYSVTTKDRLNQFLGCRGVSIYQKKGEWYVNTRFGVINYENGMEILTDGQVHIPGNVDPSKVQTYLDRAKSLNIDPKYKELYGLSDN
jgi:hypothetical protein